MVLCGVTTKAGKPCKMRAPCMVHNKKGSGKKKLMPNTCWKGYEPYGTKMKNGKEVPNCVPKKKKVKGGAPNDPEEVEQARSWLANLTREIYRQTGNALNGFQQVGISDADEEAILSFIIRETNVIPNIYFNLFPKFEKGTAMGAGIGSSKSGKDEEELVVSSTQGEAVDNMLHYFLEKKGELKYQLDDLEERYRQEKIPKAPKPSFKKLSGRDPGIDQFGKMLYVGDLEVNMKKLKKKIAELDKIITKIRSVKNNAEDQGEISGKGVGKFLKKVGKFISKRVLPIVQFGPRGNRPSGRFKDYLEKEGGKKIERIDYGRTPLTAGVKTAMNILSTGRFSKKQKELGYEDIYHDYIIVTYKDGTKRLLEKNHVIEEKPVTDEAIKNIKVSIPVKKDLSLNQMITNASYEDNEFWKYSADKKNCQDFARRIVDKNDLLPQIDTYKVLEKQKADELVNTIPTPLKGIPLLATNLANALDRVVYGDGIGGKVVLYGDGKDDKADLVKARLMINQII